MVWFLTRPVFYKTNELTSFYIYQLSPFPAFPLFCMPQLSGLGKIKELQ